MKIGILSNLYPPIARGGAEHVAWRTAHELHIRGNEVFVVSTKPYAGLRSLVASISERHVEAVYRFYPLNLYHLLKDHKHSFPARALWHLADMYNPVSAREAGHILKEEKPDVVLTHNLKGLGMQAVPEIRRQGLAHVHVAHDVQLSVPSGLLLHGCEDRGLNGTPLRRWYERRMRGIFKSPDTVVSPSRFLADFYQERAFFPDSRWEVVPNPVPNVPQIARSPRESGPIVLLYAGQLEPHKGILFLLETLNKADVDFRLHIAGEGTLSQYVSDWADRDSRVVHHGFVPFANLTKLLAISDAVVVPSLCYENSPTVIYESFGAGVPVLAADIGGIGELVKDGTNGRLFTPGDAHSLTRVLREFAGERRAYAGKEEEIRARIAPYTLSNYVDRMERLLFQAADQGIARPAAG